MARIPRLFADGSNDVAGAPAEGPRGDAGKAGSSSCDAPAVRPEAGTTPRLTSGRCRSCRCVYRWPSGKLQLRHGCCRCPQCGRRLSPVNVSLSDDPIVAVAVLDRPVIAAPSPWSTVLGLVHPPEGGALVYVAGGVRVEAADPWARSVSLPSWLHSRPARALVGSEVE